MNSLTETRLEVMFLNKYFFLTPFLFPQKGENGEIGARRMLFLKRTGPLKSPCFQGWTGTACNRQRDDLAKKESTL